MVQHYKTDESLTPIYFSTCTIVEWLCVFKEENYFQVIIDSLKYCSKNKGLILLGYVIMPNHLHLITSHQDGKLLPDIMRDFKHFTSSKIAEMLEGDNNRLFLCIFRKAGADRSKSQKIKIWRDEYRPEAVTSMTWFRQKMEYMHGNPVRKCFVEKPED